MMDAMSNHNLVLSQGERQCKKLRGSVALPMRSMDRHLKPIVQWVCAWRLPGYLQRITEVVRGVVQGEALSEKAKSAMRQDLETLEQGRSHRASSQGKQPVTQCDRENGIE
jgi:hypothetical protein